MKILVIFLLLSLNLKAFSADRYVGVLPTTAQEMNFTVSTLNTYLTPMNYDLQLDSIDIRDSFALPNLGSLVSVRTAHFIAKSISFQVVEQNTQKKLHGNVYLIEATEDAQKALGVGTFNSSAKVFQSTSSFSANDHFILLLSKSFSQNYFSVELSPFDFNFYPVN